MLTVPPVRPCVLAALVLSVPGPVWGQSVGGRVLTGAPERPLSGAFVLLLDSAGAVTRVVVTDSAGMYAVLAPSDGLYNIRVRHGGYDMVTTAPLRLRSGESVLADLFLPQTVFVLDPVTVSASATTVPTVGVLAGFYRRMARGWGHFITREEIQKRGARRISELLHGIPDLRVIQRSELESTIRIGTELSRVNIGPLSLGEDGMPEVVGDMPLRCAPLLYVDGLKFGRVDEVLDQVGPTEIEGIEIYRRSSEVPPEFGGIYARCGVIVVWTRRTRTN